MEKTDLFREVKFFAEEIRMILEKPTNPKSILCTVPPHTEAQNRAEKPIFEKEIGTDLERRTHPLSKRLKSGLSKHTRAATSRGSRQGFYLYKPLISQTRCPGILTAEHRRLPLMLRK